MKKTMNILLSFLLVFALIQAPIMADDEVEVEPTEPVVEAVEEVEEVKEEPTVVEEVEEAPQVEETEEPAVEEAVEEQPVEESEEEAVEEEPTEEEAVVEETPVEEPVVEEPVEEIAADTETEAVAKIGDTTYATIDDAMAAYVDGDTITLLANCESTGLKLKKDTTLTIEGAYTIDTGTNGITFANNVTWTLKSVTLLVKQKGSVISKNVTWTLDGATVKMDGERAISTAHALYCAGNDEINIINGSLLDIREYVQDAIEWDGAANGTYKVNIKDSTYVSYHNRAGFTGTLTVTVDNSTMEILKSTSNATNGSHFTITNGSKVKVNESGANGFSVGMLTVDNSTLEAKDNKYAGVYVNASGFTSSFKNGSKVTISGNAKSGNAGLFLKNGNFTVSADTTLDVVNNLGVGVRVATTSVNATFNAGTIKYNKTSGTGGGVYNQGAFTFTSDVEISNNTAAKAGDDIYNTGALTLAAVGDWTLESCDDAIDGWYHDGTSVDVPKATVLSGDPDGRRWSVVDCDDAEDTYAIECEPGNYTETLALKAAHTLDAHYYDADLKITKNVTENGKASSSDEIYFFAIYSVDANGRELALTDDNGDDYVVAIDMAGKSTKSETVSVSAGEDGTGATYKVYEVELDGADWVICNPDATVNGYGADITYENQEVTVVYGQTSTPEVIVTNNYTVKHYVPTGDDTNVNTYYGMMLGSLMMLAVLLFINKKTVSE